MLVGGVAIGGLVFAGIMSGPVGWAAMGEIAGIAGVIAAIVIVWAVIEGAEERDVSSQSFKGDRCLCTD